jgi:anti-sigma-K factor RskA
MSGNETTHSTVDNGLLNHDVLAFEYVTGVMRGEERVVFERLLATNDSLAEQVRFWEEQLMQLSSDEVRAPAPEVWQQIKARVNETTSTSQQNTTAQQKPAQEFFWQRWLAWSTSGVAALLLIGAFFIFSPKPVVGPNADYVAVLTDSMGAPRLTVLTAPKGAALWLKWNDVKIAADKNIQLWAISKSDGQTRPLGVFSKTGVEQLELTIPNYRLIKDAESLILTEEDIGGSALDEPSDIILAKGVCVLLAKIEG